MKNTPTTTHKRHSSTQERHPLAPYTHVDHVGISLHVSPLQYFVDVDQKNKAQEIESTICDKLYKVNHPCTEWVACGQCERKVFDEYMIKSMHGSLFKREEKIFAMHERTTFTFFRHLSYRFNYPNFPSFYDDTGDWVIKAPTINNSIDLSQRCVVRSIELLYNSYTSYYGFKLDYWMQKKTRVLCLDITTGEEEYVDRWVDVDY